ncbi:hypothetical protein B0H10DRAFT_1784870, partial [Mycena sp. CBHHK59/15]
LLRHSFLGASPDQPTLALPIRLFEIYRQIHRVCPHYSIDTLSKALTHLHFLLLTSFSFAVATKAYASRTTQHRLQCLLGNTSWNVKNVCPPCLYKTASKPRLKYSFLAAMDGNNSLKLVDSTYQAGTQRAGDQTSSSPRWLSPKQVNIFKDEVANSQKVCDDDIAWLNINELSDREAEELEKCVNTCVDRWRNVSPETRKKMFVLFAIIGIFISVCRHRHVLVMCDMI